MISVEPKVGRPPGQLAGGDSGDKKVVASALGKTLLLAELRGGLLNKDEVPGTLTGVGKGESRVPSAASSGKGKGETKVESSPPYSAPCPSTVPL